MSFVGKYDFSNEREREREINMTASQIKLKTY